jgi:hypothetical protein
VTIEELEEDIHAALDGTVWVSAYLRKNGAMWALTINGKHFDVTTKKEGMRYLSFFFLKAAEMDVARG